MAKGTGTDESGGADGAPGIEGSFEAAPSERVAVKTLTFSQLIAFQAIQADRQRLTNKFNMVMAEAGLDPNQNYYVTEDGEVFIVG